MIGFIYMWINKVNGKKYIGKHAGSEDDGYIGSGVYFKKAIKKYGLENFERVILYKEFESELLLYKKEMEIINELNAVFSLDFYNLTNYDPKIINFLKIKGERVVSEETKFKMSNAMIGKTWTDERKLACSNRQKGRKFSKEHIEKLRIANIGENNPLFGKRWYNNGVNSTLFIPGTEPSDWILGRIQQKTCGDNNPSKRLDVKEKISNALKSRPRWIVIDPFGKIYNVHENVRTWFKNNYENLGITYTKAKNPKNGWILKMGEKSEDN